MTRWECAWRCFSYLAVRVIDTQSGCRSVPDDWKNFLTFVQNKKSVIRKVHVRVDPSYVAPQPEVTALVRRLCDIFARCA